MAGLEMAAQELTPQRVNKLSGERFTAFLGVAPKLRVQEPLVCSSPVMALLELKWLRRKPVASSSLSGRGCGLSCY